MELQSEKKALVERLEQVNDISLIQAINHMLDFGLKHGEGCITIAQYNKELDEAEAEIESGAFISQEEMKRQLRPPNL
jgi:predicted nucleotide-binding protein (sugar kinase/HSP70/actin superfamily)